jgi:hypothetical protein
MFDALLSHALLLLCLLPPRLLYLLCRLPRLSPCPQLRLMPHASSPCTRTMHHAPYLYNHIHVCRHIDHDSLELIQSAITVESSVLQPQCRNDFNPTS